MLPGGGDPVKQALCVFMTWFFVGGIPMYSLWASWDAHNISAEQPESECWLWQCYRWRPGG